jgi:hypothetical protein
MEMGTINLLDHNLFYGSSWYSGHHTLEGKERNKFQGHRTSDGHVDNLSACLLEHDLCQLQNH